LRGALAIALPAFAALASAAPAAATPTVIRSGGPSAPSEAKVAVVASERNLRGDAFTVTDGPDQVLAGELEPAGGSSAPWRRAYRADLSSITDPGSYVVHAGDAESRPWVVAADGSAPVIDTVLGFFDGNRDGAEATSLHDPAHLNDATVKGGPHDGEQLDLAGGWMDAGDMLHFAQNTAFSVAALEAAARLDPESAPAIDEELEVGLDWLERLHPHPDLFVVQVGDSRDHDLGFRDPAGDDASGLPGIAERRAYHWKSGVGGDIGGKVATALGLAADRAVGQRRTDLTELAQDWYGAGLEAGRPTPRVIDGFYLNDTWKDSMAAGAAALYRVTGEQHYLDDATRFLRQAGPGDILGYADFAPFAAADLCGALGAPALGVGESEQGCEALTESARSARRYSRRSAFGPASYISWGTTETNAAAAAQLALADRFAGLDGGLEIAAGARDYQLGRNQWGASFVTDFGPHSPVKLHHWAKVFGDGLPSGSVVGGPAPLSQIRHQRVGKPRGPLAKFNGGGIAYEDRRDNYLTSEPTIDSAAATILMLAALNPA
jgi:hypothetical protein